MMPPEELLAPDADEDAICAWLLENKMTAEFGESGVMIGEIVGGDITHPLIFKASGEDLRSALADYAQRFQE